MKGVVLLGKSSFTVIHRHAVDPDRTLQPFAGFRSHLHIVPAFTLSVSHLHPFTPYYTGIDVRVSLGLRNNSKSLLETPPNRVRVGATKPPQDLPPRELAPAKVAKVPV